MMTEVDPRPIMVDRREEEGICADLNLHELLIAVGSVPNLSAERANHLRVVRNFLNGKLPSPEARLTNNYGNPWIPLKPPISVGATIKVFLPPRGNLAGIADVGVMPAHLGNKGAKSVSPLVPLISSEQAGGDGPRRRIEDGFTEIMRAFRVATGVLLERKPLPMLLNYLATLNSEQIGRLGLFMSPSQLMGQINYMNIAEAFTNTRFAQAQTMIALENFYRRIGEIDLFQREASWQDGDGLAGADDVGWNRFMATLCALTWPERLKQLSLKPHPVELHTSFHYGGLREETVGVALPDLPAFAR